MSLLNQGTSSQNILQDDEEFDQQLQSAQLDGLTDGFADDVDDDDLSLNGIYDEEPGDEDEGTPPPTYEDPTSTSAFSQLLDTKPAPLASTSSGFSRFVPSFMFQSRNLAPNRSTTDIPQAPTQLPLAHSSPMVASSVGLSGVIPNPALPHSPQAVPGRQLPHNLFNNASGSRDPAPVAYNIPPRTYYPGIDVCIVCQRRPPYSRNGRSYPTCGLKCAGVFEYVKGNISGSAVPPPPPPPLPTHAYTTSYGNLPQPSNPNPPTIPPNIDLPSFLAGLSMASPSPSVAGRRPRGRPSPLPQHNPTLGQQLPSPSAAPLVATDPCVMCQKPLAPNSKYITCGLTCTEKLGTGGGRKPNMCNYCHRRPKLAGQEQCDKTCAQSAKIACLLCKCRPKFKQFHLCGRTCMQLSTKKTPLLLDVPEGHTTWDMVQKKFNDGWKFGPKPAIKKIYKVIESKTFLLPYDKYKKKIGRNTEVFRYHGTSRRCKLGTNGNTMLCNDSGCALCCILRTSFKTGVANPHGAFGQGIYSSSAANKAYTYSSQGQGALILTKVILGKVHNVGAFGAVSSCPAGFNSVVFDRQNGALNETIVYTDDAIRPVFLLVFT